LSNVLMKLMVFSHWSH